MSSGAEHEPMEAGVEKGTSHRQQQPQQHQRQPQQQQQIQDNQGQQQQDEEEPSEASAVLQSSGTTSVTTPSSTAFAAHSQTHGAASDQAPISMALNQQRQQIGSGTTTSAHSLSLPGAPVVTHKTSTAHLAGGFMVQHPPSAIPKSTAQSGENFNPSEADMAEFLAGMSRGDGRTSSDNKTDKTQAVRSITGDSGAVQYDKAQCSQSTAVPGKKSVTSATMLAAKRVGKELTEMQQSGIKIFRDITADEANILQWSGLIVPQCPPYNNGAFKIKIDFPAEYPFKPPKITFQTKIYHPNIDTKGQVYLPFISAENWKPATKTEQVIKALVALVHIPQPDHALREDLAKECLKEKKKFFKNAEKFTKKHGETRPSD